MAVRYKTVLGQAQSQLIIEKSKFIGSVRPVATREEAEDFLASVRSKYWDATHNVPVYILGERFETQKYSDDGEPSGTAGVPVLQMMIKEGITNVALVMTRYFGGIKLGTGGLVRAYTAIAKQTLQEATVAAVKDMDVLTVRISYTYHGKLEHLAEKGEFLIRDTVFDDGVTLMIVSDPDNTQQVKKRLMEVTAGTCRFLSQKQELEQIPWID